jgi:hypothetical protein
MIVPPPFSRFQTDDISAQGLKLSIVKHMPVRGHAARSTLTDTLDDLFPGIAIGQFRTLERWAPSASATVSCRSMAGGAKIGKQNRPLSEKLKIG